MDLLKEINETVHANDESWVELINEYEQELNDDEERARKEGKSIREYLNEREGFSLDPREQGMMGSKEPTYGQSRSGELDWARGAAAPEKERQANAAASKMDAPRSVQQGDLLIVKSGRGMAKYQVMGIKNMQVQAKKLRSGMPGAEGMPADQSFSMIDTMFKPAPQPDPTGKTAFMVVQK